MSRTNECNSKFVNPNVDEMLVFVTISNGGIIINAGVNAKN